MAVKMVHNEYVPYTGKDFAVFVCDTKEEAEQLGTDYSPGSYAIVADTGDDGGVFMLNASSAWKQL